MPRRIDLFQLERRASTYGNSCIMLALRHLHLGEDELCFRTTVAAQAFAQPFLDKYGDRCHDPYECRLRGV